MAEEAEGGTSSAQVVVKSRSRVRWRRVGVSRTRFWGGEEGRAGWAGLGSKGDTEPAWVLERVARGKGTEPLHVAAGDVLSLYGGVHGVVDMLHLDEHSKQMSLQTHLARDQYQLAGKQLPASTSTIYTDTSLQHEVSMKTVLLPWSDRSP